MRLLIIIVLCLNLFTSFSQAVLEFSFMNNSYFKNTALEQKIEEQDLKHEDMNVTWYAPRFIYPTKMYYMVKKPPGSFIRLRCIAEGSPMPNITWYMNNITPIRRSLSPVYDDWSMALNKLSKSDNGHYTCKVCNELNCVNHTVELLVEEEGDFVPAKPEYLNRNIYWVVVGVSCVIVSLLGSMALTAAVRYMMLSRRKPRMIPKDVVSRIIELRDNDDPQYETIPEHVDETPGSSCHIGPTCAKPRISQPPFPAAVKVLPVRRARDISQRPQHPLPPETLEENRPYRHYDTPYEWRIFRFGRLKCSCGRCDGHTVLPRAMT